MNTISEFLAAFAEGKRVKADSDAMEFCGRLSREAMRLTTELNGSYHTPEEIRQFFADAAFRIRAVLP